MTPFSLHNQSHRSPPLLPLSIVPRSIVIIIIELSMWGEGSCNRSSSSSLSCLLGGASLVVVDGLLCIVGSGRMLLLLFVVDGAIVAALVGAEDDNHVDVFKEGDDDGIVAVF